MGRFRGVNVVASVVPLLSLVILLKLTVVVHPCCCCWSCFRPLPHPLLPSSSSLLLDLYVPPMRAADSNARVVVRVLSCVRAWLLRLLIMPEHVPCLAIIVPACQRMSLSSHHHLVVFFWDSAPFNHYRHHVGLLGYACTLVSAVLLVLSYWWACTVLIVIISSSLRQSAIDSPRYPSSLASTDISLCVLHCRCHHCCRPTLGDAHWKDKGRSPVEHKLPPPKTVPSTESIESTMRHTSESLVRLAQIGVIAKVTRRTAWQNLMASQFAVAWDWAGNSDHHMGLNW